MAGFARMQLRCQTDLLRVRSQALVPCTPNASPTKNALSGLPLAPPTQHLEKTPLEDVPAEPSELLDRDRYQRSSR
jgi:hypothetical protein